MTRTNLALSIALALALALLALLALHTLDLQHGRASLQREDRVFAYCMYEQRDTRGLIGAHVASCVESTLNASLILDGHADQVAP